MLMPTPSVCAARGGRIDMRQAEVKRKTNETEIALRIELDGTGKCSIDTGIGFFDHMMTLFAVHGLFDLEVHCRGDIEVDGHHSVEDIGIALGQAFRDALGDKAGITRYGSFYLPLVGSYDTELTEEFLRAFAFNAGITLHAKVLYGKNTHHKVEAIFKALAHALRIAVDKDPRIEGVPSSKGVL